MKKEVFRFSFIFGIVAVSLMFASCDKEDPIPDEEQKTAQEEKQQSLSKGLFFDSRELGHEYGEATYMLNKKYKYRTLKVERKSDPGKYFYVMLTNLSIPLKKNCWVYDNKTSNAKEYGYLYTWEAANALAKKVTMPLPSFDQYGKLVSSNAATPGRIINRQDLYDIIGADALSNALAENKDGYSIFDEWNEDDKMDFYYDEFVVGTDFADYEMSAAYHSLAGGRYYGGVDGKWSFEDLNSEGNYWTNDYYGSPSAHFVYRISSDELNVFIRSALIDNDCGLSVRLVFEPRTIIR